MIISFVPRHFHLLGGACLAARATGGTRVVARPLELLLLAVLGMQLRLVGGVLACLLELPLLLLALERRELLRGVDDPLVALEVPVDAHHVKLLGVHRALGLRGEVETQAREASALARSPLLDLGVALPLALALHLMHEDRVYHEFGVLLLHWCHLGRDEIADDLALLALAQIGREDLA
jgi:hypothetical protein